MLLYEAYAGSLWTKNNGSTWRVCFRKSGKVLCDQLFDDKTKAQAFQRKKSDELALTVRIGINATVTTSQKQFIAGLLDGDGCIGLSPNGRPIVSFKQAQTTNVPELVQYLQVSYGGFVYTEEGTATKRRRWLWVITGYKAIPILYDLAVFGTVKAPQAKLLSDHIREKQSLNCQRLRETLKAMKKLEAYQAIAIDNMRLNSAYLTGFFCAEGSIGLYKRKIRVSFAQKSSPQLLQEINSFYAMSGHVSCGAISFNETKAAAVLRDMLTYIIGPKKQQALLVLEASNYKSQNSRKRRNPFTDRLLDIEKEVKRLKHT